jgi:thiol-disulfide isomerase/thioredoxin
MTHHLSSRRHLLAALGLFVFFGLILAALFPGSFPKLRSLPSQDHSAPIRAQLASFGQDAEPSLEGGVGWINSGPINLAELKGKIVLLDFWTYCCINCHHVLPTLARLEAKYKNELVIIGVHSGKFDAERNSENIRRKVAEYRIKHPVVNDANMVIWERFQVSSWPTLVLITPDGKFAGARGGEVPFEELDRVVGQVATKFKDQLNLKPLEFPAEDDRAAQGPLLYPGKVLADPVGKRLFISDTGHNRIVVTDLDGKSPVVIGSGAEGFIDGGYEKARFNRQQGMCLAGETLYVADTENHAIRAIDLKSRMVSTISGTGFQAPRSPMDRYVGAARTSALSSPWDIIQVPGSPAFYIAMAGPHEIWKLNLKTGKIGVWAGSGSENIEDGDLDTAKFAQPSGLATDGKNLYVADSEVSGVRVISGVNTDHPEVGRIVGQGLFKFGDIDGTGPDVRLQHCLGLAYGGGNLFIADTYNNKIKVCDPNTLIVKTFAGDGKSGNEDDSPRFYQPGGLSVAGNSLYVADTNNHKIRVIDFVYVVDHLDTNSHRARVIGIKPSVRTLELAGLSAPRSEKVAANRAD